MLKDLFVKLVMLEMIDVYLLFNLNIELFCGEQLCIIGDIDLMVCMMLFKVSSIDGNMKLDILDIDVNQGMVKVFGMVQFVNNWLVDIMFNSMLNIDLLKGEKIKFKVGGVLCE